MNIRDLLNSPDGADALELLISDLGLAMDEAITVLQSDGSIKNIELGDATATDIRDHVRYSQSLVEEEIAKIALLERALQDKLDKLKN